MYIKTNKIFTKIFKRGSSIYSSSILSYFHSGYSFQSDGSILGQELIYNEPSSSSYRATPRPRHYASTPPTPPPSASRPAPPPPPPPPPLPKRNPVASVVYGRDGVDTPHLVIRVPSRHTATPHSDPDSLVIESKQYVKDIQRRRKDIHATLLRDSNPGERLRRMLGYKIEQRVVKALTSRKSRNNSRKNPKRKTKLDQNKRSSPTSFDYFKKSNKFKRIFSLAPVKNIANRITKKNTLHPHYIFEYKSEDESGTEGGESEERSPTPRFIVDRQGTFRWPPIRFGEDKEEGAKEKEAPLMNQSDNFTLKRSPSSADTCSDSPRVLGWLQVRRDSHVFTPAIAHDAELNEKAGPFKKAPFHVNMHVLQTKI